MPLAYSKYQDVKPDPYEIPEKREFKMNNQINPCDDFHKYVCGHVEENFKLRPDRSNHIFAFDDSSERLLDKKKSFFKNINNEKNLSARSLQFRNFYLACMNKEESKKEEISLVKSLKVQLDKIQTVDDFIEINLKNMIGHDWGFINYFPAANLQNPLIYDVILDVNFKFLPEISYYSDEKLMSDYQLLIFEFMKTIFKEELSKNKKLLNELKQRSKAVVKFEKEFAKTYPTPTVFRERIVEPRYMSRDDFINNFSLLKLDSFFDKIPKNTLIRNLTEESFEFAKKNLILSNLQILKDLYLFRNARTFMDDAFPDLYKKRMTFSHKYFGNPMVRPDRQERCTESVMKSFDKELDAELLPRLFPNFPKEKVVELTEKIRQSILSGLESNQWLSEQGKKSAIQKIKMAKLQIVQPNDLDEWDFNELAEYSEVRPYENSRVLSTLAHLKTMKDLKVGVNQKAWAMGPLTVNAYYSPDENKFVMPLGILQAPFFDINADMTDNLGAVGMVVAHELGHSIDDNGSKFNFEGKLSQWMTEKDLNIFKEKGDKLIKQFDNIGHNGKLTLGENVADNVGLTFAFNAAFGNGQNKSKEKLQNFFISYAKLWCGVTRPKMQEMWLKTDEHSLGFARINEQVKHQNGFYEAFSCTEKNKLFINEKDRIKIW